MMASLKSIVLKLIQMSPSLMLAGPLIDWSGRIVFITLRLIRPPHSRHPFLVRYGTEHLFLYNVTRYCMIIHTSKGMYRKSDYEF